MRSARQHPYHMLQTYYVLASSLAFLRTCDALEVIAKTVSGNALRGLEKACSAFPWLPREQARLKDGSVVWIGPVSSGRALADYYATLPQETLKERFHRDCVAPEIKILADKLDAGLIQVVGAYDKEGKLIGVAEAVPLRDPTKVEANFSIHPEYQGRGLSGYLVNACLGQCAKSGYTIVIAEVETSQKSVRLNRFFPQEDRQIEGRDIVLFLRFDKHPEIRQELLDRGHVQYQRRLTSLIPASQAVRESALIPGRMVAALVFS